MRILVITNTMPYPPSSGPALRLYNLLRRIATQHEVWLATHILSPDQNQYVAPLQEFCARVATGLLEHKPVLAHVPGLMRYALAGWPLELKFHYCPALADQIRQFFAETSFDLVQIEESGMALYLEHMPKQASFRRVLTFYDVNFSQSDRIAAVTTNAQSRLRFWLYSHMMHRWEPRYAGRFDRCITVSEVDREGLLTANPRLSVSVVPNGVDTHLNAPLPPADGKPRLMFVGSMSYPPCIDAMLFFHREIWPLVRRKRPDAELWIVGSNPSEEIKQLDGGGVHVTGRVPDVRPYYEQSAVSIVPLRAGGGTRLKILEAMALERPVVSTSIGSEGLLVRHDEHLLVADEPKAFAAAILRLLDDPALVRRLTETAHRLVVERYDWDVIATQQMQIYQELVHA